jgi:hypothetical protein
MISEAVAALIAGVFGYMIGDGKGNQRGRLRGRGEAEAEWSRKYDGLQNYMDQKLKEANFQIKLKVYIATRDAFFNKIKGKSFSEFTTVYSADFKSHGRDDYSENHISFPTETDAHFYGKRGLSGKYSFADFQMRLSETEDGSFAAPGATMTRTLGRRGKIIGCRDKSFRPRGSFRVTQIIGLKQKKRPASTRVF